MLFPCIKLLRKFTVLLKIPNLHILMCNFLPSMLQSPWNLANESCSLGLLAVQFAKLFRHAETAYKSKWYKLKFLYFYCALFKVTRNLLFLQNAKYLILNVSLLNLFLRKNSFSPKEIINTLEENPSTLWPF